MNDLSKCPLCGTNAPCHSDSHPSRLHVDCPSCTEYLIATPTLKHLEGGQAGRKAGLIEAIKKCPVDEITVITYSIVSSESGTGQFQVFAKYESRKIVRGG